VVQRAGGAIAVESAPNAGTRVDIALPHRDADESPSAPPRAARTGESETGHLVLVVDDEAGVRSITERILELHGYRTIAVDSVHAAIECLEARGSEVSLVLTDFAMPELNGRALLDEVWTRWPGVRTVLMSGFTADEVTRTAMLHTTTPFLAKPFLVEELLSAVRTALALGPAAEREA
jgi:DNA-binding NtrC family response regulator